jgi:hypothetical protein
MNQGVSDLERAALAVGRQDEASREELDQAEPPEGLSGHLLVALGPLRVEGLEQGAGTAVMACPHERARHGQCHLRQRGGIVEACRQRVGALGELERLSQAEMETVGCNGRQRRRRQAGVSERLGELERCLCVALGDRQTLRKAQIPAKPRVNPRLKRGAPGRLVQSFAQERGGLPAPGSHLGRDNERFGPTGSGSNSPEEIADERVGTVDVPGG